MQPIIKEIEETYKIRDKYIKIKAEAKFDANTNEQIFDEKLDNNAIMKAFKVYRRENNIISPKRIKNLREMYGLSQRDFATLLGVSSTTIAVYETGSLPSKSINFILIGLEENPHKIAEYYKSRKNKLSDKGKESVESFLKNKPIKRNETIVRCNEFFNKNVSKYTGFSKFDAIKVANLIVYLISHTKNVSKTKLNKLLFYADFKTFKKAIRSISGLSYIKLQYGPVPDDYEDLYPFMEKMGYIESNDEKEDYKIYKAKKEFDDTIFQNYELEVMKETMEELGNKNAKQLSELSHQEEGWKEVPDCKKISYEFATQLLQ